jgi:hypothetical protein
MMETTTIMTKVAEWEEAWGEYMSALEDDDNWECWAGEDCVLHVGRLAANLRDAKLRLRGIDADFCKRLGI